MSSLKEVSEKYQRTIKDLEKEMKSCGGEAFYNELKPLFEKYPEVNTINWSQYTPYFNDGDECVFSVNSSYPRINELDEYDIDEKENPSLSQAFAEISTLLESIDEQVYKNVFGDHVEVTINRDGKVEVADYEHD